MFGQKEHFNMKPLAGLYLLLITLHAKKVFNKFLLHLSKTACAVEWNEMHFSGNWFF